MYIHILHSNTVRNKDTHTWKSQDRHTKCIHPKQQTQLFYFRLKGSKD